MNRKLNTISKSQECELDALGAEKRDKIVILLKLVITAAGSKENISL
jgi:hypothetical protein